MLPWSKSPKDVLKTIGAIVAISAGLAAVDCSPSSGRNSTPSPSATIEWAFDKDGAFPKGATRLIDRPPTPQSVSTMPAGTATRPPLPPRTLTERPVYPPTLDPNVRRRFGSTRSQMNTSTSIEAHVVGQVNDKQGKPLAGLKVALQRSGSETTSSHTYYDGSYFLSVNPYPGVVTYQVIVGNDRISAVTVQLKQYDEATVDWKQIE